jgi:hypothetical protein
MKFKYLLLGIVLLICIVYMAGIVARMRQGMREGMSSTERTNIRNRIKSKIKILYNRISDTTKKTQITNIINKNFDLYHLRNTIVDTGLDTQNYLIPDIISYAEIGNISTVDRSTIVTEINKLRNLQNITKEKKDRLLYLRDDINKNLENLCGSSTNNGVIFRYFQTPNNNERLTTQILGLGASLPSTDTYNTLYNAILKPIKLDKII